MSPGNANDAALTPKLARQLPEIGFDGQSFNDVIDFLRDVSGANIFVNWKGLEADGVTRDTKVTARLKNVQFSKALQIILDSVAGNANRLPFKADQGVITISTVEDLGAPALTRVYDVRDLLVAAPNFMPDPPSDIDIQHDVPPSAKPVPDTDKTEAEAAATRQKAVAEVVKLIKETIEPQAWGKTAALRELQGQLIITAPAAMHESLMQLLKQLREGRAIQVQLEATFLSTDEGVLDALPVELRAVVLGELRAAKDPVPVAPTAATKPTSPATAPAKANSDPPKAAVLDEKQVEHLLRAVHADKKSSVISAPRLRLFSGQSAYMLTTNQRAFVADYATVKQPDGGVKYEPVYGVAKSGLTWWAQTTASADRNNVTLTMHPRLTHLEGLEEVPWDKSPPGEKLTVSKPKLLASELSTTVSMPDGGTLLLGGLKAYLGEDANKADARPMPVLMLVKAKLIVQREVPQPQFPVLDKK